MKKNALITGGNSGIGYATAELFSKNGYEVYISGRDLKKIKEAAQKLEINYIAADISIPNEVNKIAQKFPDRLDVLINNAGTAIFKPFQNFSANDYETVMNTNLKGPMELIKLLIPALKKSKGSVVNVSSLIVNNSVPNFSLYAASKGALEAVTRCLALELAPLGIRVNAIEPGAIDTPIFGKIGLDDETINVIRSQQEQMIPLKRYGTPDEVAHVIFAQAEATYVTGSVWTVDGGVDAS